MDWWGEDGQKYSSWDKMVGANNRYREQQKQNELIQKQNEILEKEQEEKKERESEERRRGIEENGLEIFELLLSYEFKTLEDTLNLEDLEEAVNYALKNIEERLKEDIDRIFEQRKSTLDTQEEMKHQSSFDRKMSLEWIKINAKTYETFENTYIKKMNMFEDYINERKKLNINTYDALYEECYNNILNYNKQKFKEINQDVKLYFEYDNNSPFMKNLKKEREDIKEILITELQEEKELILNIKKVENQTFNKMKNEKENYEKDIQEKNNQIIKLKEVTSLTELKQIKEQVIDIDTEFSGEIISDIYSLDEVILMIKKHIKELQKELLELKPKEDYYNLIDYLINSDSFNDLKEYIDYDSSIDYKTEYNNILKKHEEIKKQKEKKRQEELKKQEEKIKQIQLEEENKNDDKKENYVISEKNYKQDEVTNQKIKHIKNIEKKKNIISIVIYTIYAYLIIATIMLPAFAIITILLLVLLIKFCSPKKIYLKDIKKLGFKDKEEFENLIKDINMGKDVKEKLDNISI